MGKLLEEKEGKEEIEEDGKERERYGQKEVG
jgi:hypothetical protein